MSSSAKRTSQIGLAAVVALCILVCLTQTIAGDTGKAAVKTSVAPTTTTITGSADGHNSWNTAGNWDNGVPSGTIDAVVGDGVTAKVNTDTTPNYSGTLTIGANSTIWFYGGGKSIMSDPSSITMKAGALLQYALNGTTTIAPITLEGDAKIDAIIPFSDHDTTDLGAVTGAYTLTIKGFNNHTFNLNAANTFGKLIAESHAGYHIRAKAAGALGTGDVEVPADVDGGSAELHLDVADTIHDNAKLTMNGNGNDHTTELRIHVAAGVNEVIRALVIDETDMDPGVYDKTYDWFDGDGTLTVTGNYVPEADDQEVTVDENDSVAITLTGSDGDEDELTFTVVAEPENGTLTGEAPNLTYEPDEDYVGSDSFTFKVNDGTIDSEVATVAITVEAVEEEYTTTTITGTVGNHNTWNTVENWDNGVPTGVMHAVVADGVTAKVNTNTTPNYTGTLTLNSNATIWFYGGGKSIIEDPSSITLHTGSLLQYALNGVTNMPAVTLAGDAMIDAIIPFSDHDTTNLSAITGAHTLTLRGFNNHTFNLNAANTFSELIAQSHAGNHIRAKAAGAFGTGDVTVLPDDNDASAELHLDVADTIADTATLTMNGNGKDVSNEVRINIAAGIDEVVAFLVIDGVQMDPGTYDNTEDWLAGDGTLTVTGNYAPEAADQEVAVDMDTPTEITLEATDQNKDELTYTVLTQPTNGTLSGDAPDVTYTPKPGYTGGDSFTFKANDGKVDSNIATVTITVSDEDDDNIAPEADDQQVTVDENSFVDITLTGSDDDEDELTFTIVDQPTKGTLSGDAPNVKYTPDPDYVGGDSFTFKVNDGTEDSATATVTITVEAVEDENTAPVAQDQRLTVDENETLDVTLTATDDDADKLTYEIVAEPSNGTLTGTPPAVNYDPDPSFTGQDSFTFKAYDGKEYSNVATIYINVTSQELNDPPVADDMAVTVKKDRATAVRLMATDPENDALTYEIVVQPKYGKLSGEAPDVTYTPNPGYTGSDSFTFKANDGEYDSNTATVSIVVKDQVIPFNHVQGSGGVMSGEEGCSMGGTNQYPLAWYLPFILGGAILAVKRRRRQGENN